MIQNLIFDLGNVLVSYRWKEMLTDDFGIEETHAEEIGHRMFDDPIWKDYDRGDVNTEELLEYYRRLYPEDSETMRRMFLEGERMMVPRERLWRKIEGLKAQGYRIYILSNYSEDLFNKHTEQIPFMDKLDGRVVSCEVHKMKPEPEIYGILLERYGLKPEECMFFDDLHENVCAAKDLGIGAVQVTSEDMLISELDRL